MVAKKINMFTDSHVCLVTLGGNGVTCEILLTHALKIMLGEFQVAEIRQRCKKVVVFKRRQGLWLQSKRALETVWNRRLKIYKD